MIKLAKDCEVKKNTNPWSFDELVEMTIIGMNHINGSRAYNRELYKFAKKYNRDLKNLPLKLPHIDKNYFCSYHLFIIRLIPKVAKITRDQLFNLLRKKSVTDTEYGRERGDTWEELYQTVSVTLIV